MYVESSIEIKGKFYVLIEIEKERKDTALVESQHETEMHVQKKRKVYQEKREKPLTESE